MENCKFCHANKLVKAGFIHKIQRYVCKMCKRTQLEEVHREKCELQVKIKALYLAQNGESLRSIAKTLNVSSTSVFRWLKSSQSILQELITKSMLNPSNIRLVASNDNYKIDTSTSNVSTAEEIGYSILLNISV